MLYLHKKDCHGINVAEWEKALFGLLLSTVLGFLLGFIMVKLIEGICYYMDRRKITPVFRKGQVLGSCVMAFMHGAQDGQKFLGIFMLAYTYAKGMSFEELTIPFWFILLCAMMMMLGSCIGGRKVIRTMGMKMVKLEPYQGTAVDFASASCILLATLLGIPISTTQVKSSAIMGVGASKRLSNVNWEVAKNMVIAWIITFPACILCGYVFTKLLWL